MNSEYPELYSRNNAAQREWARTVWEWFASAAVSVEFEPRLETVIDFGCGTGEITERLRDWIFEIAHSKSAKGIRPQMVVGMDISPSMVEFCCGHHLKKEGERGVGGDSAGLSFQVADAGDPSSMRAEWKSEFDLLVSFTALHWVPDQRKVLQSIDHCLKTGGFALMLLPIKAPEPFLNGGKVMKDRWSEYLSDFVPKWRHTPGWEEFNHWRTPDPAEGYRKLAIESGFDVMHCQVEPFRHSFPDRSRLEGMIETLTPYLPRIPEERRREFIQEFAREFKLSCPREKREDEEYDVWEAECLVILLRKI